MKEVKLCSICNKKATRFISIDIDVTPIYLCWEEECRMKIYIELNPHIYE